MSNSPKTANDALYRIRLPRYTALPGTPLALVIRYLNESPVELRYAVLELLQHAYFSRAFDSLGEKSSLSEEYVRNEAFKSIWFFWGIIESICSSSSISIDEVLQRLGANRGELFPDKRGLSVSQLSEYVNINQLAEYVKGIDGSTDTDGEDAEEEKDVDRLSSILGGGQP